MASPSAIFARYQPDIERELQAILTQRRGLLYQMMRREFGWENNESPTNPDSSASRLHAILCLLTSKALSDDFQQALPAAAAVEFVHLFTTVHKDLQDAIPERGDKPSAWWTWGPGQSINLGDGLYSLGRAALFRLSSYGVPPNRVLIALEALDKACFALCQGQYMDLSFQEQMDISMASYRKMAEAKTGALMGCAMELGGIVAAADESTRNALRSCGQKLGVALQIKSDILDVWGNKSSEGPSAEVFNKRKVFPVVQLLDKSGVSIKKQLGAIYFKRVLEPSDVKAVLKVLEENDAQAASQKVVEENVSQALEVVNGLSIPPEAKGDFGALGHYIAGLEPQTP